MIFLKIRTWLTLLSSNSLLHLRTYRMTARFLLKETGHSDSITRDELTTLFGILSPGPNPDTGR